MAASVDGGGTSPRVLTLLLLSFVLAVGLRLVWPGDIEYKGDERYMFERSQAVGVSEPWPATGMTSGVLMDNPGLSVWMFVALARIGAVASPIGLARCVQVLSLIALALLLLFSLRVVPRADRERWRWAAAFACVSPFGVLFERKIWAQSILPLFSLLLLLGWWKRGKRWGALLWGLLGAGLGQIHLSGFFLAAGFAVWGISFHRRTIRWRWWSAGTAIGAIPLIPWVIHVAHHPGGVVFNPSLKGFRSLRFWKHWASDSIGTRLDYSLGHHFKEFLRWPLIDGHATYGMRALHVLALVIGVALLIHGIIWLIRSRPYPFRDALTGRSSFSNTSVLPAFLGMGVLLTLAHVPIHRHYMIVTFPLEFVWLAGLGLLRPRWGRWALGVLWAAQLLISVQFLDYIHRNHGAPGGDYGVTYEAQVNRSP
jgi:hypothetical protein